MIYTRRLTMKDRILLEITKKEEQNSVYIEVEGDTRKLAEAISSILRSDGRFREIILNGVNLAMLNIPNIASKKYHTPERKEEQNDNRK